MRAQILSLLHALQRDLGLTYLFVSHDLAVVRQISDTVTVLHGGLQVDYGPVESVFGALSSDHTRDLIAAIPGRPLAPGAHGMMSNASASMVVP